MIHTVIIGIGYTGKQVLHLLPEDTVTGLNRQKLDLDKETNPKLDMPAPYSILYTVPPQPHGQEKSRIKALLPLLKTLPRRVIYLSTSGVYGNRHGQTVNEEDLPSPQTQRAKKRLVAEKTWTSWCQRQNVELIILRVPSIYGPGRLGLQRINAGLPVVREEEANPGNRIHVEDLAACCVCALDENVPPGIYNVGDGTHYSSTWFVNTVARLAKIKPPPTVTKMEADTTFEPARLSFINESRILNTTKMRTILGFTPRYKDPEKGIAASMNIKI